MEIFKHIRIHNLSCLIIKHKFKKKLIMVPTLIAVAVLFFLLYKIVTRNFNYWRERGVPHCKPLPLFGNFLDVLLFKMDFGDMLAKYYTEMKGPYFGIWFFNTPSLVIRSPELIKTVLVKDFNYFQDRTIASDEKADPIGANFLFIVKNPKWKELRTKITPVFTSGKLKSMFDLINKAGKDLKQYIGEISIHKENEECKEVCAKFSTDVLTSTAFGLEANCFHKENSPYRTVGKIMFDFNFRRGLRGLCYFFLPSFVSLLKLKFFDSCVYKFLTNVFWQTINERERTGYCRNDVIDVLIQMKKNDHTFVGDQVVSQAAQFFAAGFETTSSTMAYSLYELCLNRDVQEKLREEILQTVKNDTGLKYDSIQKMKYLHCVVSETLRKYPVLPFLDRICIKNYKIPRSNVILEKGTKVYIPMIGIHKDPDFYPDPDKYDPERFNDENIKRIPSYAYIPFGEGPHNCIGARFGLLITKLGLIHVLSEYEVLRTNETQVPLRFNPKSFVLQPVSGINMKFKKL